MNYIQFNVLCGITFGAFAGAVHTSVYAFLFYAVFFSVLFVVGEFTIMFARAGITKHRTGDWPWDSDEVVE
ncbi:hypothetical protein [Haloarcula sp. CGMCC 1.6347]|uniref:hypothetical protein n=1 Tax=Haloarcula sp. CGMCC 1.6347 TaxID=3111455 RepID=UPI00300E8324